MQAQRLFEACATPEGCPLTQCGPVGGGDSACSPAWLLLQVQVHPCLHSQPHHGLVPEADTVLTCWHNTAHRPQQPAHSSPRTAAAAGSENCKGYVTDTEFGELLDSAGHQLRCSEEVSTLTAGAD